MLIEVDGVKMFVCSEDEKELTEKDLNYLCKDLSELVYKNRRIMESRKERSKGYWVGGSDKIGRW